ncbi:5-hydroxytryptamine receptor 3A-like [Protopterus annectens]|uniref:5-hydroxytryptamine receptor 3A-like n=1 Tax=Protopterus annectens TaxID=7888 RepID=UPI001CF9AFB5|nr:5-hydroxytryptamine receptor 3A-like [Protopterus annectens]
MVLNLLKTVLITYILYLGHAKQFTVPEWIKKCVLPLTKILCVKLPEQRERMVFHDSNNDVAVVTVSSYPDEKEKTPVLSFTSIKDIPEKHLLSEIYSNIQCIRKQVQRKLKEMERNDQWIMFGNILDTILFRIYMLMIVVYIITLGVIWAVWYNKGI